MPDVLQTAFFLAQSLTLSRSDLRWEFANVAAAIALLAIAFVALAVFLFFRRPGDLTLIYFGSFCTLYGVRLLALGQTFRSMFNAPGTFWSYVDWVITCTIIVPFGLFLYQIAARSPKTAKATCAVRSQRKGFLRFAPTHHYVVRNAELGQADSEC
jgi:ABC-type transport system involved in multi-copper enzyme maturation permease subunit